MPLKDILTPEHIHYVTGAMSKKRVLELISSLLSQFAEALQAKEIFKLLVEREKLGNTAIGEGIALPHLRSDKITRECGVLIVVEQEIDYDSDEPVHIFFAMLVPEHAGQEHLNILKDISILLTDDAFRKELEQSQGTQMIRNLVMKRLHQTEGLIHVH